MMTGNLKMAIASIRSNRGRSLLTMLGIIIGVALVMITVSLGEGVKRQVSTQLEEFGPDLITVRPGQPISNKTVIDGTILFNRPRGRLSEKDAQIVSKAQNVRVSSPLSLVSGTLEFDGRMYNNGFIIGANPHLPELFNHDIEFGAYYSDAENGQNVAVIGQDVARELFNEDIPIGKSFILRGKEFMVRGVFKRFASNPLTPGGDYNTATFIPYQTANLLTDNTAPIFEILAKPSSLNELEDASNSIKKGLLESHGNQEDFTIFSQNQNQLASNNTLALLGTMVGAVAVVSLLVGGIGVMNIMLVAVTERTHEIGVRKAVGATKRQILGQFVVEAATLSVVGSIIGVIVAIFANYALRAFTDLQPVINFKIALLAVGVSLLAGILFGAAPAIKAARKDPVEALRAE